MKTSSKYVITFLQRMSGRKILLIKVEKAAGSMDIPVFREKWGLFIESLGKC